MKTKMNSLLLALALAAPAVAQAAPKKKLPAITDQPAAAAPVADPGWPRVIERDGMRLLYEQPQIDEWKDYRSLKARVAFSLTQKDGKATVGIAELQGNTVADLEARTVFIEKLTIASARFPGLSETEAPLMEAGLKKSFPGRALTVSLDRLIAGVERTKESFKTVELNMDAPPIFAGSAPAALLIVDGKPVLAPVEGTKLQFLVNTNWDVFFEPEAKAYYLLSDKTWLTSDKLETGWTLAVKVPDEFGKLPKDWEHVKKALPVKITKGMKIPALYFSDKPAELIGYAQWGTSAVSRGNDYVRAGHIATEEGGVARWKGSEGGGKVKWTEDGAKGVAVHDGNMYAGKDGNVYRRDQNGDWDKYGGGGDWEKTNTPNRPDNVNNPRTSTQSTTGSAKKPANTAKNTPDSIERRPATRPAQAPPAPATMENLNREAQSRDRGVTEASRQQNFQKTTSTTTSNRASSRTKTTTTSTSINRSAEASSRNLNRSGTPRTSSGGDRKRR